MEIIGINECDHDYEVVVAIKAHELMDIRQAMFAYVRAREDWWIEKGCPTPNKSDKDWRMTMDMNLHIMLKAREMSGAWGALADGAQAWAERIESAYYDDEEENNGLDED